MKKIIGLLGLVLVFACKKEKTETPEPIVTPTIDDYCTGKVNGVSFSADSYFLAYAGYFYNLTATKLGSDNGPSIVFYDQLAQKGTFDIGTAFEKYSASYEINNIKYTGISGTITITELDTVITNNIKKFKASFSFDTDTINGVSYKITDGNIYYTH